MIVDIQTRRLRTIEQLRAFVEGSEAVDFHPRDREEANGFVRDTLERFGFRRLGRRDKGVVLAFLVAATGISRPQIERLVRQWRDTGEIRDRRADGPGRPFARRYTAADVRLLAATGGQPPDPRPRREAGFGGRVRAAKACRVSGARLRSAAATADPCPTGYFSRRRVKGPLRRPRRLDAVPRSAAPLRCARPEGPAAVPASRSPLTRPRRPSHSPRLPFPNAGPPPLDRQRRSLNHPRHRHLDTRHRSLHGSVGFTITFSLDNGWRGRPIGTPPWGLGARASPPLSRPEWGRNGHRRVI